MEREPLSIELISVDLFKQNPIAIGLEYLHYNPVKAGICENPENYYYSSARFYHDGLDSFKMLTHFTGN